MADKQARGLADVVAASTALSDIDGQAGRLSYRGYDIHDLGGRVSFEECTYLLQRGGLPTSAELAAFAAEMADARTLGATAETVLPTSPPSPSRWRHCAAWSRAATTIRTRTATLPRRTRPRRSGWSPSSRC